jgi:phospholipase C
MPLPPEVRKLCSPTLLCTRQCYRMNEPRNASLTRVGNVVSLRVAMNGGRRSRLAGFGVINLGLGIAVVASGQLPPLISPASGNPVTRAGTQPSPIEHVVIIFQENHTFDNVLGIFCLKHPARKCNGARHGRISTGRRIKLRKADDIVPLVRHRPNDQKRAIHRGAMDGYNHIPGCGKAYSYRCYTQFHKSQIPALWELARNYVISSRTFELRPVTSWAAHLQLGAATLNGFVGYNPSWTGRRAPGWGCDSFRLALWRNPGTGDVSKEPSCIPKKDGKGPWRPSPVQWVPTIMDRLSAAGLRWRIYAPGPHSKTSERGYAWAVCPSFARCLYTRQRQKMVDFVRIISAAKRGNLPAFSIVIPSAEISQHNGASMSAGDRWIAKVVNAIGTGPDWRSTTIFITYDDCGCFYDHVPPPGKKGIRVPMVIVSPYAKRWYTDRTTASFASMLAYTEHNFGLTPLTSADRNAYDYVNSFNYDRRPRRFEPVPVGSVPASSRMYLRTHSDPIIQDWTD